jgi:hypothetical protein
MTWRVFGSVTPEVAGYRQSSFGGEFTHRLLGDIQIPPRTARLDAKTKYVRRMQIEQSLATPSDEISINENDLTGALVLRVKRTSLTGSYTQSVYDRDFSPLAVPQGRVLDVAGVSALLEGYPDRSYTFDLTQKLFKYWQVWGSYANIRFKAGDRSADSYTVGTGLYWKMLEATVDYNIYKPTDGSNRRYLSFGGGLRF